MVKGGNGAKAARNSGRTAVAYYRTSSAANVGADKDSVQRQRDAVAAYAKAHGLEIVKEFYDAAVSGADPIDQRPGFIELLEYVHGDGARTILVENAGRFARDLAGQLAGHDLLKARGIDPIPVDVPGHFTDETPTAVMVPWRSSGRPDWCRSCGTRGSGSGPRPAAARAGSRFPTTSCARRSGWPE